MVGVLYARYLLSLLFVLLLVGCGSNQEPPKRDAQNPVGDLQTDFYSGSRMLGSPEELWRVPLGSTSVSELRGHADGSVSVAGCYPNVEQKHLFDVTKDGKRRQVTPDSSICNEDAELTDELHRLKQTLEQTALSNVAIDPRRGIAYAAKTADRSGGYGVENVYLEASGDGTSQLKLPGRQVWVNLFPTPTGVIAQMTGKNGDEVLVGYNSSLEEIWRREIPLVESKYGMEGYEARVTVDANGYVIIRSSGVGAENTGIVTHIDILNPKGEELKSFTAQNRRHEFESSHITATTPNRLYMVIGNVLVAYKLPGIGMEYPLPAEEQLELVVMGDSYSSGEGVEPFDPQSGDCHRSEHAYAQILADELGDRINLTSFVACSGAETEHFDSSFKNEPPQLEALSPDTDIVVLTVGGNDVGFGDFADSCVLTGNTVDCAQEYNEALAEIRNKLPKRLHKTYAAIRAKVGKEATVLVIGYPHIVLVETPHTTCDFVAELGHVTGRKVVDRLNKGVETAAEDTRWDFTFVSATGPDSPFWGHQLCTAEPYFVYPKFFNRVHSFHPNKKGQEAYAQLVIAQLKRDGLI